MSELITYEQLMKSRVRNSFTMNAIPRASALDVARQADKEIAELKEKLALGDSYYDKLSEQLIKELRLIVNLHSTIRGLSKKLKNENEVDLLDMDFSIHGGVAKDNEDT